MLRDVRKKLTDRHSLHAAATFHAAKLALTRDWKTSRASNVVSHIYEIGSDFGNSVSLPLFWLVYCFVAIFLLGMLDGVSVSADAVVGWQNQLGQSASVSRGLRSFLFSLNSVFNPLNLIVSKPLVAARLPEYQILASVFGLLGIISFALLLLSIRRRFKLE